MTSRVFQGPKVTSHSVIDALQRASTLESEIFHFSHLAHNFTAQSKIPAFLPHSLDMRLHLMNHPQACPSVDPCLGQMQLSGVEFDLFVCDLDLPEGSTKWFRHRITDRLFSAKTCSFDTLQSDWCPWSLDDLFSDIEPCPDPRPGEVLGVTNLFDESDDESSETPAWFDV